MNVEVRNINLLQFRRVRNSSHCPSQGIPAFSVYRQNILLSIQQNSVRSEVCFLLYKNTFNIKSHIGNLLFPNTPKVSHS